jgi:hypothetical protein
VLPEETLEADVSSSSLDRVAMLKSLRSGLGAYRDTKMALNEKNQRQGVIQEEASIDFSLPPGPCPENLSFLIPRLHSRDPKMQDAALYSVSIRESIKKAGTPERVIQASRAQVEEFRRALRDVTSNNGLPPEKKRDLVDTYKDGMMANEASARVVECYINREGRGNGTRQAVMPSQKDYCGNAYQIDCGNDLQCQREMASQPKCP